MTNRIFMQAALCLAIAFQAHASSISDSRSSDTFSLNLSSSVLSLSPGQSGYVTVGVVSGCRKDVAFSASGFPSGVTYAFSPVVSKTASYLVVYVSPSAALGSYPITVMGTADHKTESTSLTLAIVGPNFSVTAPSDSLTLARGTYAAVPITVTPGPGFTGTVTFGLTGLPPGVIILFSPASSTTGSTLYIYAYPNTAVGTYPVTLTGTSNGATSTASGTLIIQ